MKAILEFNLDNPEDRMNHKRCVKASDMAIFIWELKHNFLRKWKHDSSSFNIETYRDALDELLDGYHIDVDELNEND
tara:strand:- start:1199 stop:1429 length:231 start_codon:yes stop_codon:yes gene_type:complete